jgi:hypothetical protein
MNKVYITDCNECNDSCPDGSYYGYPYGCKCLYESNEGKVVPHGEGESYPIPDWCPKLNKQKPKIGEKIL